MSITVNDLERTVNSSLTTAIIRSEINFDQLFIEIDIEDLSSTILYLKTNEKCKFKQLIDITAVDYPKKEKRFKIVYLLLSHENNLRIVLNVNINEEIKSKKVDLPKNKKVALSKNKKEKKVSLKEKSISMLSKIKNIASKKAK